MGKSVCINFRHEANTLRADSIVSAQAEALIACWESSLSDPSRNKDARCMHLAKRAGPMKRSGPRQRNACSTCGRRWHTSGRGCLMSLCATVKFVASRVSVG